MEILFNYFFTSGWGGETCLYSRHVKKKKGKGTIDFLRLPSLFTSLTAICSLTGADRPLHRLGEEPGQGHRWKVSQLILFSQKSVKVVTRLLEMNRLCLWLTECPTPSAGSRLKSRARRRRRSERHRGSSPCPVPLSYFHKSLHYTNRRTPVEIPLVLLSAFRFFSLFITSRYDEVVNRFEPLLIYLDTLTGLIRQDSCFLTERL